jgi:transcriptional regulator GlxA family with amidase domain
MHDWIRRDPSRDLNIDRLADFCAMSPRTFYRRYKSATGMTPGCAVEKIRVECARRMLENSTASIHQVAAAAGFGHIERMRRSFTRHLGVPPRRYRQRFGQTA